jgi:hypothetical protein
LDIRGKKKGISIFMHLHEGAFRRALKMMGDDKTGKV